ncbi:hypothetical protein DFH06DRAFT_1465503 [Mycena polygramma]|nr:hypothetical protein DFH06DRAFT_1465503 [Mycena polygramma]
MDASAQTDDEFASQGPDSYPYSSGMYSSDSDGDYTDDELTSRSTQENDGHSTGMFSDSQNFTVTAGTMTNVTKIYNTPSTVESDFRRIPLGDIDLRELRLERGSAPFIRERRSACRVYAARVEGRKSGVTVAIYEGNGAKEDWRKDISRYSALRHPSFVQLWGLTNTPGIHAAIFHDDLIPFEEFVNRHRDRPVLLVYIYVFCGVDSAKLLPYFNSVFGDWNYWTCTLWIRASTGRLCVDPIQRESPDPFPYVEGFDLKSNAPALTFLSALGSESIAINSLSVEQYHETVGHHETWLSQANHVFTRLHIKSNLKDYGTFESTSEFFSLNPAPTGIVDLIEFNMQIQQPTEDVPPGYLFLCPEKDFQVGPSSYRWPQCPAYWTLDPTGIERLGAEEATRLGFPPIELETKIRFRYWDSGVYAGLRQFHEGKGFDPDSQAVARHMGHQLYRLPDGLEALFAHLTVEPRDFWSDDKDWNLGFADRKPQDLRSLARMNNGRNEDTREKDIRILANIGVR